MTKKAIVLVSGGVDSITSLYWALDQKYETIILSFNYISRPRNEKEVVQNFATLTNSQLVEVDVPYMRTAEDLQKDQFPVNYKGIKDDGYIPAKNLVFYSIACYYAEAYGAEYIIGGHILADASVFPDASKNYFAEFNTFIEKSLLSPSKPAPKILTPLIALTKEEVGKLAKKIKVPLEKTWSCYKKGDTQCGTCETCQERLKAINRT